LHVASAQTSGETQAGQAEVYSRLPQLVVQTAPAAEPAAAASGSETIGTVIDTTA
jgi:hypothetical protein